MDFKKFKLTGHGRERQLLWVCEDKGIAPRLMPYKIGVISDMINTVYQVNFADNAAIRQRFEVGGHPYAKVLINSLSQFFVLIFGQRRLFRGVNKNCTAQIGIPRPIFKRLQAVYNGDKPTAGIC